MMSLTSMRCRAYASCWHRRWPPSPQMVDVLGIVLTASWIEIGDERVPEIARQSLARDLPLSALGARQ
jgi:hypothetical protein